MEKIIKTESAGALVVGLPRGLDGQHTAQTDDSLAFAEKLKQHFSLPVHLQDEAVTSKQAEAELEARGKAYVKDDIDALAATYILEDWLSDNAEGEKFK
jgi:putative Holliday junction resolvase